MRTASIVILLAAAAATRTNAGRSPEACFTPAPGSAVRKGIFDSMRAEDHNPMGKPQYKVNALRVCGEWAYVDASPCYGRNATNCAEGGWTLLRREHRVWTLLPTPREEACDAMNGTFASPGDECVRILKARNRELPLELFKKPR